MSIPNDSNKQLNFCVGKQILNIRNIKGKSQKEITAAAGFSVSLLNKYETGENLPGLTNLYLLSELFQIPMDQFLKDYHPDFVIYAIDSYLARIDQQKSLHILNELRNLVDGQ